MVKASSVWRCWSGTNCLVAALERERAFLRRRRSRFWCGRSSEERMTGPSASKVRYDPGLSVPGVGAVNRVRGVAERNDDSTA